MRISQFFGVCCIAALTFACSTGVTDTRYPSQLEPDLVVLNTDLEPEEIRLDNGMIFIDCTREQAQNLISTVAQAQDVLDVVLKARHLERLGQMTPPELLDIEHRCFGNMTESLRHYMTEILEVVRNDWNQTQYICEVPCDGSCDEPWNETCERSGAAAFVYSRIPGVIHLCENFHLYRSSQHFSAVGYGGNYGPIKGASTILHEKVHLVHHGVFDALSPKRMHPIIDHAYRPLACQQLVHDSPELTFLNADSWANYMSEVYLGVKVGIPPRHIHTIVDTRVTGMEVFGGLPAYRPYSWWT